MYFKGIFHKALFMFFVLSIVFVLSFAKEAKKAKEEDDFDRLDGTGKSRKRVDVIEWKDNLEIHVYPAGSLAGLGLKLVKEGDKKVMVIAYRFTKMEEQTLVRRAILGIPLMEGFETYRDTSATPQGYDKIIIANKKPASKNLLAYQLDAEPTQLYPEGHPMLAEKEEEKESENPGKRTLAGDEGRSQNSHHSKSEEPEASLEVKKENKNLNFEKQKPTPAKEIREIRSFSW